MLRHVQAAGRFARVFARGSRGVSNVLRAGRGKAELPHEALEREMVTWGKDSLEILNVSVHVEGVPSREPLLFLGNHMSYLDIPLLMSQVPLMFVAKKQIASWPIFGTAVRKFGMVLVDRDSAHSRGKAAEAVSKTILERKHSVAIFPSGTTRLDEEQPWRWGAFSIAKKYDIPVQPFRLRWEPARAAAYLLEDTFAPHLWKLLASRQTLEARLEFHPPVRITDPEKDCSKWWNWSREENFVKKSSRSSGI